MKIQPFDVNLFIREVETILKSNNPNSDKLHTLFESNRASLQNLSEQDIHRVRSIAVKSGDKALVAYFPDLPLTSRETQQLQGRSRNLKAAKDKSS